MFNTNACILKVEFTHTQRVEVQSELPLSMLFLNSWRVRSHIVRYDTNLQLFKNSIDTQEKLRLNLHSLSVSELLEYGRKSGLRIRLSMTFPVQFFVE